MTIPLKRKHLLLIAAAAALCISGCAKLESTPVKAPKPVSADGETAQPIETELSPKYHYLESRIHGHEGRLDQAVSSLEKAIEKDPDSALLKRDLIRFYLKQNKKEKALELSKKLVELQPENVENLLMLARFRSDREQDKELPDLLRRILELDPKNKESYLRLGKIYMGDRKYPQAVDLFSRMTREFPGYYVAHFYLGEALMGIKSYESARNAYQKTIELEPDLVEPRFRLIDIYRQEQGQDRSLRLRRTLNKKILEAYEAILKIEPDNFRAKLETALVYYQDNQKDKADLLFARLAGEAEADSRLVMVAVDTYISQKRHQDAVIVFSQMLKHDPGNDNLNFFTGMAYESIENPMAAIEHYSKVNPAHPQYKKTLFTIAFIYRNMGKLGKAVKFLEQHHEQEPNDIDIILYLSSFYEFQDHLNKAVQLLEKGISEEPENTSLLFRLGVLQDKQGLKAQCIETMKKVIHIDPEDASALNYLGYTYADMGIRLDQAHDLISRALKIKPDDGYITDSLGWVYYQKKEYETAVIHLEKAAELSSYEPVIAGHLADAYVKTHQLSKALETYEKALSNARKPKPEKQDMKLIKELETKLRDVKNRLEQGPTENVE